MALSLPRLASILNVKPIAVLKHGVVDMVEKVRTRKVALERVIEMAAEEFGDQPIYLGIVHARDIASGPCLDGGGEETFQQQRNGVNRPFHFAGCKLWSRHGWIGALPGRIGIPLEIIDQTVQHRAVCLFSLDTDLGQI